MDLEKLKELILRARTLNKSSEFDELVDHFEEFVRLYQGQDREEDKAQFAVRVKTTQDQFWGSFEKVARRHGLSKEAMAEHLSNPHNFTPQQWLYLETIRQDMAPPASKISAKTANRKLRKQTQKMRI